MTRSRLAGDLRRLGVRPGGITMVHARMSALGWVVGAAETVVLALIDALGPAGTALAYTSWEEHVYRPAERPEGHAAAYLAEPPAFDLLTSEAVRDHGRVPERLRTWPGAMRSAHPEASVVAVGPRAAWLTATQPTNDAYGAESPFAGLVEAGGQVLMLGAPLDTMTLLHHAEALARSPRTRRVTYEAAVVEDGRPVSRSFTDIDTGEGAFPYDELDLDDDPFAVIARAALDSGLGTRGRVGEADCQLFDAAPLTAFAVAWIEERFGA